MSELTVVSESGEILYHYKWADPRFLDLSISFSLAPGSVGMDARNIACHFRTPLVSKKELTLMNFSSLSSTPDGKGEFFYRVMQHGQDAAQDKKNILLLARYNTGMQPVLPDPLPKYLTEVYRLQLSCTDNKARFLWLENYDASNNLVALSTPNPLIEFEPSSPYALLQRIVCPTIEFGGLGIEVAKADNLVRVVTVMDGTPAAEVGIKANDIITHLNDESVDGLALDRAIEKMRGPVNTKIKLKIKREGQENPIELSITRAIIKARSKEVQK